jgi:DNA end-binding protein Ku
MARATIWKGYIHFGDTDVPVKLHTAVKEERIQFHLLHKRDKVRVRQQMVCAYEKEPVPAEEQSKGFEVEDGKYIIVDPEELQKTAPEDSRMIEVHEFVKTEQIDPIFLDRVYYLEPDITNIQGKGYNALVMALKEMDVTGICTWTMRKALFRGVAGTGRVLRLNTMRMPTSDPVKSLQLPDVPLSERTQNRERVDRKADRCF